MTKWAKRVVQWRCGDTLYLSVVFSWQLAEAEQIAAEHKGNVVAGGAEGGCQWKLRHADLRQESFVRS